MDGTWTIGPGGMHFFWCDPDKKGSHHFKGIILGTGGIVVDGEGSLARSRVNVRCWLFTIQPFPSLGKWVGPFELSAELDRAHARAAAILFYEKEVVIWDAAARLGAGPQGKQDE